MFLNWGLLLFYAFVFVAVVQLLYYLFFFSRLAFYQSNKKEQSQTHPVSVIICARDEDENLARNLPGLLVQQYPTTHEVIVVNDNSVDESRYVLSELKNSFRQLQIIDLKQEAKLIAGKKYPLSVGIKEAKHEIVLLTDADCVPASECWIDKMQQTFTGNTEIVLGYGAYRKRPGLFNKLVRWETFHTALQYLSYALAGIPYMGVGRNLAYKKVVFFRNKGFTSINHIPSGDDDLFINKAATKNNTAIMVDKESFTLSTPKKTWKEWKLQKNRHYSTGKFYKKSHQFLLGFYTLSLFLFYPLFILSLFFFDWRFVVIPFAIRLLIQAFVLHKTMKRLGEEDLFPFFFLLDLWMFFYYIIFAPALCNKPAKRWN